MDFQSGFGARWSTSGVGEFLASVQLPAGAKVVSLALDFFDTTPSSFLLATLVSCDRFGSNGGCVKHPVAAGGPSDCHLDGYLCTGLAYAGGASTVSVDLTAEDIVIDNVDHEYVVDVTGSSSNALIITGALIGYVLQVSPAPAVATFTDVPTSDFAFQFIEAFNAAGITVGCNVSPPQFCPDANVTRREMAVFFAKALGLQFP